MLRIRRSEERGHADHGWLRTYHTFSFADYYDEEHVHYGTLRVLNQDFVAAGAGFPTHAHRDMEIVTVVLEGALEHRDSMGNGSRMVPGDVQLMSAGTGVTHSEFNGSKDAPLHLLQMWVLPRTRGQAPRYEQKRFAEEERRGRLRLVVAPDGRDGALTIGQEALLYVSTLGRGERVQHALLPGRGAWLHVATGRVRVDGEELRAGDGAALEGIKPFPLEGLDDAELVLWDLKL
jgi:redox-sensitive bicupin YhaK (pirin superfamily)